MSTPAPHGPDLVPEAPSGLRERHRWALARLSASQKPPAVTPAYLRYVNRPLGGRIAAAAFAIRATPDQVTAASGSTALAALLVTALVDSPGWALGVVVAVVLLVAYALDSADGQLSRLRGGGSPAGEWLDHVVDCAKAIVLHGVVLVWAYRSSDDVPVWFLLVPLAFLLVDVTTTFGLMLRDQLQRRRADRVRVVGSASPVRSLALLPVDHACQCLVFALLGSPSAFQWSYLALGALTALFSGRALMRAFRTLRDAPA